MREILFRGKAINRNKGYHRTNYKNGDWVYGLVTNLYDDDFPNVPAEMRNTDGVSGIEVDYKTIGQYTGLTDKNGKRIFEGDIVKHHNQNPIKEFSIDIGSVFYYSKTCRFLRTSKLFPDECLEINSICEYEVIGNIHDNPELMKEVMRK